MNLKKKSVIPIHQVEILFTSHSYYVKDGKPRKGLKIKLEFKHMKSIIRNFNQTEKIIRSQISGMISGPPN